MEICRFGQALHEFANSFADTRTVAILCKINVDHLNAICPGIVAFDLA